MPLNNFEDATVEHTGSEEQRYQRKYHFITKIFAEEEHSKHHSYGYETKNRHGIFDQLQHLAELLDIGGELFDQLAWEDIRPKAILALSK